MPWHLFGTKNTCVEDLDTPQRNTSTVARVAEGCTHAGTINQSNNLAKLGGYVVTAVLLFSWEYSCLSSQIDAAAFYGTLQ